MRKIVYVFGLFCAFTFAQDSGLQLEGFYDDPSVETQYAFVQELLYVAGYTPEEIQIYQTLPNSAHVYRVKLDSVNGGFMFVRWDNKKKEHFLANKMIDPGVYYNLNAAREIMRNQTNKEVFTVEDVALQAPDQETISTEDIDGLRQVYELEQEEKKIKELERLNNTKKKRRRRKN